MEFIKIDNPKAVAKAKEKMSLKNDSFKQMDLPAFVQSLAIHNNIYIKGDIVIPFKIVEDMVLTTCTDDELLLLKNGLEECDYNLSSLVTIPMDEVYQGALDAYDFFFVIRSKYKVIR